MSAREESYFHQSAHRVANGGISLLRPKKVYLAIPRAHIRYVSL
jgi:hypothetical protein